MISESGAGVSQVSDSAIETIPLTVAPEASEKDSSSDKSPPSQTTALCDSQSGNVLYTDTMLSMANSKTWFTEKLQANVVPESKSSSQVPENAPSIETVLPSATETFICVTSISRNQSSCDEKPIKVKLNLTAKI
jgi:hypothetical protein